MGELQSALDALAAQDVGALGAEETLDRTSSLVRAQNRIAAELARTTRHAENIQAPERDGKKSMTSWLTGALPALAGGSRSVGTHRARAGAPARRGSRLCRG